MTALPFPDEVRDRVVSYIKHQGSKSPAALVDLVKTSQQKFIDLVASLPDDVAAKKPAPDEWCLRELIRHVIDAESGVAGLVHNLSRGMAPAGRAGPGRMADDEGGPFADFVEQLRAINTNMIYAIEGMPADPDLDERAKHPFFGDLNCKEWAAFQRIHDEDHVQHAQKILAAVS